MLLQLINILYVLVAIGIIAFVLLQQGSGAQAGSGFGGGASATVFGARGASNFLSKSTKWLAIVFFVTSMGLAMYASKQVKGTGPAKPDLGVMAQQTAAKAKAQVPVAPAQPAVAIPAAAPTMAQTVPAAGAAATPQATAAPATANPAAPAPAPGK